MKIQWVKISDLTQETKGFCIVSAGLFFLFYIMTVARSIQKKVEESNMKKCNMY